MINYQYTHIPITTTNRQENPYEQKFLIKFMVETIQITPQTKYLLIKNNLKTLIDFT